MVPFEIENIYSSHSNQEICNLYCSFNGKKVSKSLKFPCKTCNNINIISGIISCKFCNRWYPIINSIPRMLPDKLRPDYSSFVEEYAEKAKKYGINLFKI
jgi:uncharacterized protein YbaR (Trm112 family)